MRGYGVNGVYGSVYLSVCKCVSVCLFMWVNVRIIIVFECICVYLRVCECIWVYLNVMSVFEWTSNLQLFPEPHTEFRHHHCTSIQTHLPRFRIPARTVTKIGIWIFPNTPKSSRWWANFGISTSWPSLHTGHQRIYANFNSTRRVVLDIGANRCKRRGTHHFAHIHATQGE